MDPAAPLIDFSELIAMRREAIWDAVISMPGHFLTAAAINPWMWFVLLGLVIALSAKAWMKLVRFVGGAYLRQNPFS